MTMEDALVKYEKMVYQAVRKANTNTVCAFEDLAQEGKAAICAAFESFDQSKGASFNTYVWYKINGAILDYQKHNLSQLSGGAYLYEMLRKHGEDSTVDDLIAAGFQRSTALASLHLKKNYSNSDFFEISKRFPDKRKDTLRDNLAIEMFDWRSVLDDQEVYILEKFFGFSDGVTYDMTHIGKELGLSRKEISKMIKIALEKIKHIPDIGEYAFCC